MKSLSNYILEQLDVENIKVKVGSWFRSDEAGRKKFDDFVINCKTNHKIAPEELDEYYSTFTNCREFVDFVNDDINGTNQTDYRDSFMNIIRCISCI